MNTTTKKQKIRKAIKKLRALDGELFDLSQAIIENDDEKVDDETACEFMTIASSITGDLSTSIYNLLAEKA